MLGFIVKRILTAIPTLVILVVISFFLIKLAPGGPFTSERKLPPEVLANIEKKYNLDQPLPLQLWNYFYDLVFHFDLGPSFAYKNKSVNEIIADGFPITFEYGIWSFIIATFLGLLLGFSAALKKNGIIDYLAVSFSILAQVLPNFIMAPLLMLLFTLYLGWLPGGGWVSGQWEYLVMPVIALSTSFMASITRISRSSMIEVLNSNHIRTAKAKGLPFRVIVIRHALKPALLPVVSYLGPTFVVMITGSVLVDVYFSTGGLGLHFVNSALNRDYSLLLGITIVMGTLMVLFSLVVDIIYFWLDPRQRIR